jgi:hypothetical protein
MSFFAEFGDFLKNRKRYWLLPIVVLMVLFGALLLLSQGSAMAPFIYSTF